MSRSFTDYLQQLWKSRTVKLAVAELMAVAIAYLNGAVDLKLALTTGAVSVLQIFMRTITNDPIRAK